MGALDAAMVDLVRVALTNDGPGVRQLARRLLRRPPDELAARPALKRALALALSSTETPSIPLRRTQSTDPWDDYEGPSRTRRRLTVAPDPMAGIALDLTTGPVDEPVLPDDIKRRIDEVVLEHQDDRLRDAGLAPTRTVLLLGPPGVGKSLSAAWIAQRLGRPLMRLDLASLMGAELGSSGKALRAAFRSAADRGALLLLDELDAIARTRGEGQDVGEARRLVNILLLELDNWPAGQLLIAATNHADLIDSAARRRFDVTLDLPGPDTALRREVIVRTLAKHAPKKTEATLVAALADATAGLSHSDLVRATTRALRASIISDRTLVDALIQAFWDDVPHTREARDAIAYAMRESLGLTDRAIAKRLGISHPTVAAAIGRYGAPESPKHASR